MRRWTLCYSSQRGEFTTPNRYESRRYGAQVQLNLTTSGSLGNVAHIGNIINGTTLIPDATYAEFHSVNGAIFGGLGEIKLMSGAKVESVPFQPPTVPDAGSTMLLMSIGVGCLAAVKKKFIS